jgi:Asp-tRNA(Asn)/Glu-tRNA(Gln) amidotransferase A subunit family amidase
MNKAEQLLSDPTRTGAVQIVSALRHGALSVEALTRACLDRIAERDGDVRAWCSIDPDTLMTRAREMDRKGPSGPLHGLPVGVKDVILTRDMPTQYNSPIYQGFHPAIDAACIRSLRAAGALIFGKTDTTEFAATGRKAITRNPHHLDHTPGGSSSGSAASVADFHVPLAMGTQTGGSTIRPASFSGVYAIKPTWNLVSSEGLKTFSPSLDTVGWFARSAQDLMLVHDVLAPSLTGAETPPLDLRRARIGVCRTPWWDRAEEATQLALEQACDMLRAAGATIEDVDLPEPFAGMPDAQILIMRGEGRSSLLAEAQAAPDLLDPELLQYTQDHWGVSHADLLAAYNLAARCREMFDAIAGGYDAILTPSAVGEAPSGLISGGKPVFNGIWTLLHVPCVNVPGMVGPLGLPVGLTLTGPRFGDRQVLAAAAAVGAVLAPRG